MKHIPRSAILLLLIGLCLSFSITSSAKLAHHNTPTIVNDGFHDEYDTIDYDLDGGIYNDTIGRPVFGPASQSITISTSREIVLVKLQFTNNIDDSIIVSGFNFLKRTNFSVQSISCSLPVMLAPGEHFSTTLQYSPNASSDRSDQFTFSTNYCGIPQSTYLFYGIQPQLSSVKNELTKNVSVEVSPNPMNSQLKISASDARSLDIVIFDLSGKPIKTSHTNASEWIWDGTASDGTQMLSGTYLVRTSGISTSGEPFVTSSKIILNK